MRSVAIVLGVVSVALSAQVGRAQCVTEWLPGFGTPSLVHQNQGPTSGFVRTLKTFDPDGDGPLGERLLAAGRFTNIDGWTAGHIAVWDGQAWTNPAPMPEFSGGVNTVAVYNGEYYVGGLSMDISRWNGTQYVPLGANPNGQVLVMTVFDGQLYIGGEFVQVAQMQSTRGVVRWNGTAFQAVGTGVGPFSTEPVSVRALTVDGDQLYVGGDFGTVGGLSSIDVGRWSASGWQAMPGLSSINGRRVNAITKHLGDIHVGGSLQAGTGEIVGAARWNGSTWETLPGTNGVFNTLNSYNGVLIGAGATQITGLPTTTYAYAWNGSAWTTLSDSDPLTGIGVRVTPTLGHQAAVVYGGKLIFGGEVGYNSNISEGRRALLTWDGTRWETFAKGLDGVAADMVEFEGDLVLTGAFRMAGGRRVNGVCRWDGDSFEPMGLGILSPTSTTTTESGFAAHVHDGQLYIAGLCSALVQPGGQLGGVARWNGTAWERTTSLNNNPTGQMYDLTTHDGSLFMCGNGTISGASGVLRYNGTSWVTTGATSGAGSLELASFNNALYVAGEFGMRVWDGTGVWTSINPSGFRPVELLPRANDMLMLCDFPVPGGSSPSVVGRFNGSIISPIGSSIFNSLGAISLSGALIEYHGDIIAGKQFNLAGQPNPSVRLARWNGLRWGALAGDVSEGPPGDTFSNLVRVTSALEHEGVVWITGYFGKANGASSPYVARYRSSQPPAVTQQPESAIGCPGGQVTFSVASATEGVSYGWRFNGTAIQFNNSPLPGGGGIAQGINLPTLTVSSLQANFAGTFDCVVTNACGSAISQPAALTVRSVCCDSIDFNNDTNLFDPQDIEAFLSVYSEGPCVPASASCNDIDFNNDTSVFDPCDISSFLVMYSEGPCTPCGM